MQVRSLTKRHKSLEEEVANHLPVVEDLFKRAENFEDGTENKVNVDSTCEQLSADVRKLKETLASRAAELETAVKTYALLEEINEIEGWIQVGDVPYLALACILLFCTNELYIKRLKLA